MNAQQRRKFRRASNVERKSGSLPRLVRHWSDLAELPESETHRLEIDVEGCNGWIHDKRDPEAFGHYLSTHTFYGSKHKYSTALLRKCGFNVTVANWDEQGSGVGTVAGQVDSLSPKISGKSAAAQQPRQT